MTNKTSDSLSVHRDALLNGLLTLPATGGEGFEGFVAAALTEITGQTFRLARSGSQDGQDGAASTALSPISFEGKLYSSKLDKDSVLGKLPDIAAQSNSPDLWLLAATVAVPTQISGPLNDFAKMSGISVVICDCPQGLPIPPLATMLAMAPNATTRFLGSALSESEIEAALRAITRHADWPTARQELWEQLSAPTLGVANAANANRKWLRDKFSHKAAAHGAFGQPLAPLAPSAAPKSERSSLVSVVGETCFAEANEKIIVLSGGEGTGKSWVFAQAWSAQEAPPLTLVLPSRDVSEVAALGNLEGFLIQKLIDQTGDHLTDVGEHRWRRRFGRWKESAPGSPRLVVLVDGLNEKPELDWRRFLDLLNSVLSALGGKLVISVRQAYYQDRIKRSLVSERHEISVPEWTKDELTDILRSKGIEIGDLSASVVSSLRNPRLLGIAFELLDAEQIEHFHDLSPGGLLFEHIRKAEGQGRAPEGAKVFIRRLADHANEIIKRIKQQQVDDRLIFDAVAEDAFGKKLDWVSQELFFQSSENDSTYYQFTDEGLDLALGLALIAALKKAERNGKDLDEALDALVEPVAALDRTASVVFEAMLVSGIDEQSSTRLQASLIRAFISLQNIDDTLYPAFVSVVRRNADAAMQALYNASQEQTDPSFSEWLIEALRELRNVPACWANIRSNLHQWLRFHSLAPEAGIFRDASDDGYQKELETRREQLAEKVDGLTSEERAFLDEKLQRRDDFRAARLSHSIFSLLAGMPLEEFAAPMVAWSFGQALNGSVRIQWADFHQLIRFNPIDWAQTRQALLEESAFLSQEGASRSGVWSRIEILRATATLSDAIEEARLYAKVSETSGWNRTRSDDYSDTDPCDPESENPSNLEPIKAKLASLDLGASRQSLDMSAEDHLIRTVMPAIARFAPEAGLSTIRAQAENYLQRTGAKRRHGFLALDQNAAALTSALAKRIRDQSLLIAKSPPDDGEAEKDSRHTAQYGLHAAMPFLDGDEQLSVLQALPPGFPILLSTARTFQAASATEMEAALKEACQSGNRGRMITSLVFATFSDTPLSSRAQDIVATMAQSEHSLVRAYAFALTLRAGIQTQIAAHASSGWSASGLASRENHHEIWYGSRLLVEAAQLGEISATELMERISPGHFGEASYALGAEADQPIRAYLDSAISKSVGVVSDVDPPPVDLESDDDRLGFPPLMDLREGAQVKNMKDFFERFNESDDDYQERRQSAWKSFEQFRESLTQEQAEIIVGHVTYQAVRGNNPDRDLLARWASLILSLDEWKLRSIHPIATLVARALSEFDSVCAVEVFERASAVQPFLQHVCGKSKIAMEAINV